MQPIFQTPIDSAPTVKGSTYFTNDPVSPIMLHTLGCSMESMLGGQLIGASGGPPSAVEYRRREREEIRRFQGVSTLGASEKLHSVDTIALSLSPSHSRARPSYP